MSKPRQITGQDMADYYGAILRNGKDLPDATRQYLSELREGALAVDAEVSSQGRGGAPSHDRGTQ